jgi:two-component system response regulator GlrR
VTHVRDAVTAAFTVSWIVVVDSPPLVTEDLVPAGVAGEIRGFTLTVLEGGPTRVWSSTGSRCAIGSHPASDLVLDDATVSRFHCEVSIDDGGARIRDLESRNGTLVDGVRVVDGYLRPGSAIRLGRAKLQFDLSGASHPRHLSKHERFGTVVGRSVAMRATFALLERAAASSATVLLEGETGTGKGAMAEAVHNGSSRRGGPFVVVDCGALSPTLLDSELFGHERGAFTGADMRRIGAFEEADGGTVFLDEIGEMSADLQPKLLRVLESKQIRRLGQNTWQTVDVRVIAATNRDLRSEVNAGRFRSDLYYRLAVIKVPVPALRHHSEDLPPLVDELLRQLGAPAEAVGALTSPDALARMAHAAWPGNVRELRNYLERSIVMEGPAPISVDGVRGSSPLVDVDVPYAVARERNLEQFERAYVESLLVKHGGKVTPAAQAAGIARVYLHRLMRRHGILRK